MERRPFRADCAGIGVGSPGICNGDTGEVVYSNNLYWDDVPLCPTLTRLTGLPCRLSNDANCAALGEVVAGAAKGCKTAVLLTLGTGVGGGVVIDGKIYEGQASAGAELGHCTLISGGVECTCGRRGCIESYASATALIRQASEAAAAHPESLLNKERITAKSVYDAMRAGDDAAKAVVAQYEEYLGEAIVDMVNIFRPEMLLLGGGISGEGKALTDPMNEYVKAHCFGGDKSFVTRVDTATLGNKAGIIGAAALCLSAPAAMPLKLAPAFKDYLWGGERLKSEYGKHTRLSPLAESWELSCHKDGPSTIVNGPDAGRTLAEYAAGTRMCGDKAYRRRVPRAHQTHRRGQAALCRCIRTTPTPSAWRANRARPRCGMWWMHSPAHSSITASSGNSPVRRPPGASQTARSPMY
ncbi:MAG: ROK family protein [Ruthenibacterium lactatiformans]